MNKPQIIGYIAGRSGGHIIPALTLIKRHKAQRPDDKIVLFTASTDLDIKITQESPYIAEHKQINLDNVPKRKTHYPKFLWRVFKAFLESWRYLRRNRPHKIVSMGGYISIPIALAAYFLRIPIEIYELNVIPGKANMFLARYATTIFICFGASSTYFKRSCTYIGYPLRFHPELRNYPQNNVLNSLNFSPNKKTVLIVGGSQGSLFINGLIREWLLANPAFHATVQIIHQTGAQDTFNWYEFYQTRGIKAIVFDYTDSIEQYYLAADLIIARAGAGTLFEIQFFNKPCITIPLETASTMHQTENARAMAMLNPYLFTVLEQKMCEIDSGLFSSAMMKHLTPAASYEQRISLLHR